MPPTLRLAALLLLLPLPIHAQSPITYFGRLDQSDPQHPRYAYPGSGFTVRFTGTALPFLIEATSTKSALTLVLDNAAPTLRLLQPGINRIDDLQGLTPTEHTLTVYKRTETWQGVITLRGLVLTDAQLLPPIPLPLRKLMFLGDSVTCGAGVDNNATCKADPSRPANDAYNSYGLILGRRLDAQSHLVCYGGRGLERDYLGHTGADGTLNAPQFLDLAIPTDDPRQRAPWNSSQYLPDAIVVSLGTNDFNLQKTSPLDANHFVSDYVALLQRLRAEYPHASIFATEGAIVTDPLLRKYVQQAVAQAHDPNIFWTEATHYPGNGCDGHPTRDQHRRMADDLEPVLRQQLHW